MHCIPLDLTCNLPTTDTPSQGGPPSVGTPYTVRLIIPGVNRVLAKETREERTLAWYCVKHALAGLPNWTLPAMLARKPT
jgi:hypothetical protein